MRMAKAPSGRQPVVTRTEFIPKVMDGWVNKRGPKLTISSVATAPAIKATTPRGELLRPMAKEPQITVT